MRTNNRKIRLIALLAALYFSAVGCATNPKPLSDADRQAATEELKELFEQQEPVTASLTLADALARALKYNVDHRVRLMEEALARTDINVARMDLLPRITAEAGYVSRSNQNASSSQSVTTGQQTLEPSTSEERDRGLADATLVWNLLDFGVSYVTAKQRADAVLIAEERRRKAIQNIVQEVRAAYWQALAAQRLGPQFQELVQDVETALSRSRQLQEQGLQSPSVARRFQESLLVALRQLGRIRQQMSIAKTNLGRLMNMEPGIDFELSPSDQEKTPPEISQTASDVEEFTLTHRPELREEDYRLRIDKEEVRKSMLRMLPGIEVELGASYDSNDFLVNTSWSTAGLRLTWNLFNLFSGPAFQAQAKANVDLDNMRRLAVSMAVLTQVHVAYERYRNAANDYKITSDLVDVSLAILNQVQARDAAQTSDRLSVIRARARALVAQLQGDDAFAELQNSVGRIQNSMGLDPMPEKVASHDLNALARAVAEHQANMDDLLAMPNNDLYQEIREPQPLVAAGPADTGSSD